MDRPLPAIKALARQHQEAIWALHQTNSRLRSVLLEFYPQALQAFPKLNTKAALAVLTAAPSPAAGLRLTEKRVIRILGACGRGNHPKLVEQILTDLKTQALRQTTRSGKALGLTVASLIHIIASMHTAVDNPRIRDGRRI